MRILLIEDEPVLGEAVATHLKRSNHAVDWVQRIDDAQSALQAVDYGLVLLDLHLPDGRGLDVLRALRAAEDNKPVIILTARDQIRDRIEGLNAGADDYLVKPFDLDELVARILSVQRRSAVKASTTFQAGNLTIDPAARKAWSDEREVPLTAREWALLECLTQRAGAFQVPAGRSALCVRLGNRKQCRRGLYQPLAQEAWCERHSYRSRPRLPT